MGKMPTKFDWIYELYVKEMIQKKNKNGQVQLPSKLDKNKNKCYNE